MRLTDDGPLSSLCGNHNDDINYDGNLYGLLSKMRTTRFILVMDISKTRQRERRGGGGGQNT